MAKRRAKIREAKAAAAAGMGVM
ncbi:hypothetical protein CEUSTIGMA_g13597.t1, partial [Chlamydomonas eustigma]